MPAPLVTATATMTCTFGAAPAVLTVLPATQVLVEGKPAATIKDCAMGANVAPFAMCSSMGNPAVVTATTAAQGVLTPQPCTPQLAPWTPGVPLVSVGGTPAVNGTCTSTCAFGGAVTFTNPGATQTLG